MYKGIGIGVGATIGIGLLIIVPVIICMSFRSVFQCSTLLDISRLIIKCDTHGIIFFTITFNESLYISGKERHKIRNLVLIKQRTLFILTTMLL